ncbi:MAG TPA: Ig-like domain-containing protein [Burkholderiaceae bacterium]|nr:Ig-like domain-containing protein [Burkholderiaceae bacterium]
MSFAFALRRLAFAAAFASVAVGASADVSVRFSSTDPSATPFPSDRFTMRDFGNNTFRRVNLPRPADCASTPAKAAVCADLVVINELDGFSTQPRITIPFTGAIDPASVTSDSIYLVNLGDTLSLRGFGQRAGINQVVWDPATNTLALQPDDLLQQHSRYLLVVTNGVRDASGQRIKDGRFIEDNARSSDEYDRDLRDGMRGDWQRNRVVAASLFTTQSITADLQKIAQQIKRSQPAAVDFMIGNGGTARAVFALSEVAAIQFNRQNSAAGPPTQSFLPTPALSVVPGSVGRIAYGRFASPDYETAGKFIPVTDTLTGSPAPQGSNGLIVQMFLPAGAKPAGGWPVAIFGHGFTDSMYGAPWTQASIYASQGIATISINVVGHGGGAQGALNVLRNANTPVSVPAGGRGIDQDGNGTIDSTEGVSAAGARNIISSRDGLRQTVVDLMQLVRQIEAGVDVDGDGSVDLDANRIYYAGQSFGGIYGTIVMGVERSLKAGVVNVPGGSITEIARLSPAFRGLSILALNARGLLNAPAPVFAIESIPLRDQPPLVNTVPGAMDIQQTLDRFQWVQQAGNPVSYAQHIRKQPLPGNAAKSVIVQFAKGDQTVPNPTSSALIRAGDLEDRATFYRNDLAFAANAGFPKNPHTFLTNIGSAVTAPVAIGAQTQIAIFFVSNGATTIDPDGAGPLFEVPIASPLPETLSFIP